MKRIVCAMLVVVMLICCSYAADPTQQIIDITLRMTEEYDLPDGLLLAVIEVESNFDTKCVTGKCRGLMQIHSLYSDEFAKDAGLKTYNLYDPYDNIRIGACMLAGYIDKYPGDLHMALMCYNLGEAGARSKRKNGTDTTSYSRKVISKIEKWADVGVEPIESPAEVDISVILESIKSAILRSVEVLFK